jgi:hypothetical protein
MVEVLILIIGIFVILGGLLIFLVCLYRESLLNRDLIFHLKLHFERQIKERE